MSPFSILILLLLFCFTFYVFLTKKPWNAPPGLLRLPIVGSYWFLLWKNYSYPHKALAYYSKKLKSNVISCYLGDTYTVVANDYASIKEVSSKEEFDGRAFSHIVTARAFGKVLGIFFVEENQWKEQRRFALRHMRDFGFGRRQDEFEAVVQNQVSNLVDLLKNGPINEEEKTVCKDGMVLLPFIHCTIMSNLIWYVIFGKTFERSEYLELRVLFQHAMQFVRTSDTSGGAISMFPILKFFGNLFGYRDIIKSNYGMVDIVKTYIEEHREEIYEDKDAGLVGRYFNKLKEENLSPYFSEDQLIIEVVDLMIGAMTTVPNALGHLIKAIMHHPNVTKKIQAEIDSVIGPERSIIWEDRKSLPYVEATIREILRFETITPLSMFHKALEEGTLQGHSIPRKTSVVNNLGGMHLDPDHWGDPEVFRPERFLNENGELSPDSSLSFGSGHRVCPGETFSRYTMFGIFSTLMQKFNFHFIEGQPTRLEDKFSGLIVTPKDTWIGVKSRY